MLNKRIWLICSAGFIFSASPIFATTYTTAILDNTQDELVNLNWDYSRLQTGSDVQTEYQIKNDVTQEDSWQTLTSQNCQENKEQTLCILPLSATDFSPLVQFRFTYQEENNLNVHLEIQTPTVTANEQVAATDSAQIVYGPIKNIDANKRPTQLSWQALNYSDLNQATASAKNNLLVQYRAYDRQQSWSSWQGNSQVVDIFPNQSFTATTAATLLNQENLHAADFLFLSYLNYQHEPIFLSYKSQDNEESYPLPDTTAYQLPEPIILADQEAESTQAATFVLNTLDQLQIGETLVFTEEVNGQLHRAQGEVSDIKKSENLITIGSWQGVIPLQGPEVCNGHRFCFSPAAQVYKVQDYFLPLPRAAQTVSLSATSSSELNLSILKMQTEALTQPLCFEGTDKLCTLEGFNLNFTQSPLKMQYRLVNFDQENTFLNNIFLHQEDIAATTVEATSSSTLNRLRHGKIIDSAGISHPYYWH